VQIRRPCFFAKLHQLRQAGHRAVIVQNLAKHACWLQAGQTRKIDRRLGMPGASQHAAILCAQRKNMSRLHEIIGR